ncbi:hypothetical protein IU474_20810 [Nocardia otitidiscaviarum]|uniref:hypothetical protein n=1 Tax=Nocardia otitidiscaviarum TaxID=1823 RepID=UPI0018959858|nr:hypothetical protein [Nocardia otitidiscaviarum]MBF6239494.1 hypothetical protein [Nocardia otitidiscaviarum]
MKLLRERGGDPFTRDRHGISALDYVQMVVGQDWRKDAFTDPIDDKPFTAGG